MAVQIVRKRFTIDEYEKMIEKGVLHEDDRLELIRGEIVEIAPIGLPHEVCVMRLTKFFERLLGKIAIVSVQNSLRLPGHSQPQPDVVVLKWRDDFYAERRPTPEDTLLVVEVSDTTLAYDRRVKLPLYAEAGVPEVWIVNLAKPEVEVYTQPQGSGYAEVKRARRGETLPLPGKEGAAIKVEEIVG